MPLILQPKSLFLVKNGICSKWALKLTKGQPLCSAMDNAGYSSNCALFVRENQKKRLLVTGANALRETALCSKSSLFLCKTSAYWLDNVQSVSFSTTSQIHQQKQLQRDTEQDEYKSVAQRILEGANEESGTVTQKAKNFTLYIGTAVGLCATCYVVYVIISEYFSLARPNAVYRKAVNIVTKDQRVLDVLGHSVKTFGEETSRGRRRHASNIEFVKDGRKRVRVQFYVKGNIANGICQAEVEQDDSGSWDFRYIFVQTDERPSKTVIVLDNRAHDIL